MRADTDDSSVPTTERATGDVPSSESGSDTFNDPVVLEPTEAEIDAWAERERKRREAWLKGPTADERAAWARRERERRLIDLLDEREAMLARRSFARRYGRETQLAAEGMMSMLWRWSRRNMSEMVRAGREWEDEFARATKRRRVSLDDDDF